MSTKPLFEFSDIELKAIAFDYHETIRNYQTDLDLIRTELNRSAICVFRPCQMAWKAISI
jgi:hypothetical protein